MRAIRRLLTSRRSYALALAGLLLPVLLAALLLTHTRRTALSASYLEGELQRLQLHEYTSTELYAAIIDAALEQPRKWLPADVRGLPALDDPAFRAATLALLRTALPPAYVQTQLEAALVELLPYLRGDSDGFRLTPNLGPQAQLVLGATPGRRSPAEIAFRELDLGRAIVLHIVLGGTVPPGAGPIVDEYAEWFTAELFRSIAVVLPYLAGEVQDVTLEVGFAGHELLAEPFSSSLSRTPQDLLAVGFVLTAADIEAAADEGVSGLDAVHALRPGWSLDERDLLPEDGSGATVDTIRNAVGDAARGGWWASLAAVAILAGGVGLLGGRRWPTRVAWAAGALLLPAAAIAQLAGPAYELLAASRLHDAVAGLSASWSPALAGPREVWIADVTDVAARWVSGGARLALWLAVASGALLAASLGWARRTRPAASVVASPAVGPGPEAGTRAEHAA